MTDLLPRLAEALKDRYTLQRELGHGGMATVYLAQDLRHDRQVALKVLPEELAATLGDQRFHREIRIAAQLQHPNILPLLDSGEAAGCLYYTMPYVEGQSLRERLTREGALPIADAVRILRDVADALTEAHAHGVVHRDIKPENILLHGHHALVADFGVAKAVSEATGRETLTTAGVALGTPAYMAPEQAAADPHLDHRVDLYALGAVAYEVLTGRPVFMGTSAQMVLSAHLTEAPQPIRQLREAVPPALEALVMRCLAKERADRWQRAEEVLAQLEALATPSSGVTPTQTRPVPALGRWPRWMRWAAGAVAATIVVVVGFGLARLLLRGGGATLDRNRVLVVAFAGEGGSDELQELGRMAQDYVIQVLTEAGFAKVVDPLTALVVSQNVAATGAVGGAGSIRALAQEAGAGTVVSGTCYAARDSLQIQVRISDARNGNLMGTVGPIVGSRAARSDLVGRVGREVVAALAPLLNQELGSFEPVAQPATYEAYEAYTEGLDAYLNDAFDIAAHDFERALAADPTFSRARLWWAQSLLQPMLGADYRKADSVLAPLAQSRSQLSRYDRCRLDFVMALAHGTVRALDNGARCMAQAAPGSDDARREVALFSLRLNRPREAIRLLRELDPDHGLMKRWPDYWGALGGAYHALGEYEQELEAVRQGLRRHPASVAMLDEEASALAALGRLDDVAVTLRAMRSLPSPQALSLLGNYMADVGLELRAHGYRGAAREAFDEAIAWYQSRPQDTESARAGLAGVLYDAERWDDALRVYEELAQQHPENTAYLGALGRLAARRGDRGVALSIHERLRAVPHPAMVSNALGRSATRERASIAALLGDRDQAVRLLQQAIEGSQWGFGVEHVDIDFESLRDYPPFQELMRPRG